MINVRKITAYVKYFMEHLEKMLIDHCNPVNRATYFSVLFDKPPTYQIIKDGTKNNTHLPEVNELFKRLNCKLSTLADYFSRS